MKSFEITIANGCPGEIKVELFRAICPRNEHRNQILDAYNTAKGFISTNTPANTMQGILKIAAAGNFRGVIGFTDVDIRSGFLIQTNNAGTQEIIIGTSTNAFAPYKSILEMIKGNAIKIKKVRVTSTDLNQLKLNWELKRYHPDGTTETDPVTISNSVSPQQVRADVIEFYPLITIDKFTAIEIPITPLNVSTLITFYYEDL